VSSDANQVSVADVIAHELAHQWFGDLVTMEWWTDLWLNEGFAAYTEFYGTEVALPEAGFLQMFPLLNLQPALAADSLLSSHPISIEVNDPAEINQIFDSISYLKGSSVIRMMANFLGIETFNKGITNYLHSNAFGNANQDNLWQFLTEAAVEDGAFMEGNTVKQVMDTLVH
jgi:aminopeptidase N